MTDDDAFGGCPLSERPENCCGDRLECANREQLKAEVVRLRAQLHAAEIERLREAVREARALIPVIRSNLSGIESQLNELEGPR